MKVVKTSLPEVVVIEPDVLRDSRGFFMETFHARKLVGTGIPDRFVQDNQTRSMKGVLRGPHGQHQHPQGKLVRVTVGEIFDVAVDIRKNSPRFGQWVGIILDDKEYKQVYIPPGFLHGFCVLSEVAEVFYKCTDFYDPSDEIGVRWDDPQIGIRWPISTPLLSPKDAAHPSLAELTNKLR